LPGHVLPGGRRPGEAARARRAAPRRQPRRGPRGVGAVRTDPDRRGGTVKGRATALIVAVATVTVAGWWWGTPAPAPVAVRAEAPDGAPNVLLIVWDTTRADHLSLYGYERPTTPWLEGFAREAVVFERAISPGMWTPPSHAS